MNDTKDAYQRATAINDQSAIERWNHFESILDKPFVLVSPDPYLRHIPGYEQRSQPTQEAFDASQAIIVTLLTQAIASTNSDVPLRAITEQYVPPSGYQRAGMISATGQVNQWILDNPTASFVAGYSAEKAIDKVPVRRIVKSLPLFGQSLVTWWDSIGVPSHERRMSVLGPAILVDACMLHAQAVLGHPDASGIKIVPSFAINADYECFEDAFNISVAIPNGMLVYALTNRARIVSISLYDAHGAQEIDIDTWRKAYPATTQ